MATSKFLLSFFILFSFDCFPFSSSSSSLRNTHKCSAQQTRALLLFKKNLNSTSHPYDMNNEYDVLCHDWLGSGYYPVMENWKRSSDCCSWDGVSCNPFTGDVIALDVSCGMLRGTIHPNTTLLHLPYLQRINLAFNDVSGSDFLPEITRFAGGLTHLNISNCGFTGQVPQEISFLPKLVSLDLSWNWRHGELGIQPYILNNLMQNSTHLRELVIASVSVNITPWVLPSFLNLTSSLKTLDFKNTRLQGKLPNNIFNLPHLEKLDLSDNTLTGPLPKGNTSTLKWLDLSFSIALGEIPDSILHLNSLSYLRLSYCGLMGPLSKSILHLRHLVTPDLMDNMFNGTLPAFLFTLPLLQHIHLDGNMFSGGLPSELFNCRTLKELSLSHNQFDGKINQGSNPPSFIQLINLVFLDLSSNNFTGLWELDTLLSSLTNLEELHLSYSGLSVMTNDATDYANPHFRRLGLAACNLTVFPKSLRAMKNLEFLDLSSNDIQGNLPDWAGEIGGHELNHLNLSHNSITGLPPFQWDGLKYFFLQSNLIQGPFPQSICNMSNLYSLDMSYNRFGGVIPQSLGNIGSSLNYMVVKSNRFEGPIPPSICNMSNLRTFDVSNNSFGGVIPPCLGNLFELNYLNVKSNVIQGPFPSSICNMSFLQALDMSNNNLDGVIPQCVGNMSSTTMINLGNNKFHGIIPNVNGDCQWLHALILNGNQLEGEVPSSLSGCQNLELLDLGNNLLTGNFPGWLGDLQYLQVLVLRSNNLHGPIETSSTVVHSFPNLQVLELSHNGFVGHLPGKYFQNFNAMKNFARKGSEPQYLGNDAYGSYSLNVVMKGQEFQFTKIFIDYKIVDLSNNKFEGEIPNVIGNLNSLVVLDLSNNSLTGQIPYSLGNLSEIESLDLSWNQLTGEIPQNLADLTFLEFLNLSQNHLTGRIPRGPQLGTFNASFGGNPGLCGLPLPKMCEDPHDPEPHIEADGDTESGFTWRVVMLGYGCGTILGLLMGSLMLSTGRPKWFNAIAETGENLFRARQNRR